MGRGLSAGFKTALQENVIRPAYFVRMDFRDTPIRLWSGSQPITTTEVESGETFQGAGSLGSISPIDEGKELASKGVVLSLVGQGSGIYAAAAKDRKQMQGRKATIWMGLMSSDFASVLYAYELGSWIMDTMSVEDVFDGDRGGVRITIQCESELRDMFTPNPVFYSDKDQRRLHPGDTFLRFISTIPDKEVGWMAKATKHTRSGSGIGSGVNLPGRGSLP